MRVYKFTGETISPVTIGSGEEIEPFDYIIEQGLFYRISLESVVSDFTEEDRNKFYNIIESGNINNLRKFITNRVDVEKHSIYCCQVSDSVEKLYRDKFEDIQNQLLITPFIRNGIDYLPFIPGSSIKGSIRTAVLSEMGKNLNPNQVKKERYWEWKIEGIIFNNLDRRNNPDAKCDPFRAVKIRDINFPDNSTIIAQIKNVAKNRRGNLFSKSMQLFYEVSKSKLYGGEIKFSGEIIIDEDLQAVGKIGVSKKITIDMIKDYCNSFYREKLESEHRKFYRQSYMESNSNALLDEKINNDSFIIRLGRFSGVESVTLDGYREPKPPGGNSRNICEEKYPMGWIKITLK